ncbi:glycosyltransferase family 39 protein, partial [Singulisphaera rosea]
MRGFKEELATMSGRRCLFALALLAAALHVFAIARTFLPAQDGLKFLRTARQFQASPWVDVIRGTDQHPLYPALVALAEPVIATILGHGPDTWRIAAQTVAAIASVGLLIPLFLLTRALFDGRIGLVAALVYVVLPLPAAIGHDTLSDSLALLAALSALAFGEKALRSHGWIAPIGCGIVSGLGFLARPEVLVVPVAVLLTSATRRRWSFVAPAALPRFAGLAIAFLTLVGAYATVKGQVSEKLALRQGTLIGGHAPVVRRAAQWLPPGLNDSRWDFSPKEESEVSGVSTLGTTSLRLFDQWAEGLCGVFAFFAIWGMARDRFIRGLCGGENPSNASGPAYGRRLLAVYLAMFSLVLIRHTLRLGYLSDRHTLMLVLATIPWAAAGTFVCARGLAIKLRLEPRARRLAGVSMVSALIVAGVVLQTKTSHPSRWGHRAAGEWLATHTNPSDAVLDTRGWASFVSRRSSYDYWHVRQAFTDSHLAYVVVGTDELEAK